MDRSRLVAVAVGGLSALLFVTVSTAEPARIAKRQPSLPWELPTLDLSVAVPTTTPPDGGQLSNIEVTPSRTWELFTDLLQYALIAVLIIVVIRLLRRAWLNRPRLAWTPRSPTTEFVLLDDLAEAVVADADAQHAALRTGAPRNAIVACWLRLEAAVEDAGIEHDPTLTSSEITARVLARFDIDAEPTDRLASLYREARFSSHEMREHHRAAAIDALDAIHTGLRSATAVST